MQTRAGQDTLANLDKEHVWHPYTQMAEYNASEPLVIVEGEGRKLKDAEGNWYYDGTSSIWLNVHGHRVPEIDAAITQQLGKVAHSTLLGQANEPSILLAERLAHMAPDGLEKVFYSDSGSEAIEAAIKMAVQYWANLEGESTRRKRILSFTDGYHGDTLGAVGAAPVDAFHWPFAGLLPEPLVAPFPAGRAADPDPRAALDHSLSEVERILDGHPGEVAAVVVEAMMQGISGVMVAPDGFLAGLAGLCRERGVLLIADEVATGFGRTGRMFACEHDGVSPDLMALGKGLTGGYLPLAATLTTDEVYDAFLGERSEMKTFFHGHSFTGNQLCCAAALASLDLMEQTRLVEGLPEKERMISDLAGTLRQRPNVGAVRHKGVALGVEISGGEDPVVPPAQMAWDACRAARERGLLVRPIAQTVFFMPPPASTPEELSEMLAILDESLRSG